MTKLIEVDAFRCRLIGGALKGIDAKNVYIESKLSRWQRFWVEFIFVSICHKTNWDILHSRIYEIAAKRYTSIASDALCNISAGEFRNLFGGFIREEKRWDIERCEILDDIGCTANKLREEGVCVRDLDSVTLGNEGGLYEWLDKYYAYSSDPLRKKSRVLVHQLLRYNIINVRDEYNILPAIDYHLIRLYVRTGRVVPQRQEILERLKIDKTARVEFQTALRRAVEDAMWHTSAEAEIRIDVLNHYEWQIGRSFCLRERTRCERPYLAEKPIDRQLVDQAKELDGKCPLYLVCGSRIDERLLELKDPSSAKIYY